MSAFDIVNGEVDLTSYLYYISPFFNITEMHLYI